MRWLGVSALLAFVLSCSDGEREQEGAAGTSASGAAGATSAGAGNGGSSAGRGGEAGSSAAGKGGAAGAGGTAGARCEGSFGTPTVVLTLPGQTLGSLSLGPGELELIYATGPITANPDTASYRRSVRASADAPFPEGVPVPELDAACGDPEFLRSGDLSADGLRYYFVCYLNAGDSELHLARRSSLEGPFVLDSQTYGLVGPGPTLGPDEFELMVSTVEDQTAPRRYARANQAEPFGGVTSVEGIGAMITPELSADGHFLFGSYSSNADGVGALGVAERASSSASFDPPSMLLAARDTDDSVGSVAISADCRSLYYVDVERDYTGADDVVIYRVMVMKR